MNQQFFNRHNKIFIPRQRVIKSKTSYSRFQQFYTNLIKIAKSVKVAFFKVLGNSVKFELQVSY